MAGLWEELRRRNVVRVGLAYLAAVWVLIQVADVVLPRFGAPDWIVQALIASAALGFPVALVLTWFYDLTPEGVRAASDADFTPPARSAGRKVDFAIIGLLVIAVGFLLLNRPSNELSETTPSAPLTAIAVLPFDNLSPDPDNAYFAFGMHEEILNALAKISALDVKARTSVMRFAASDVPIEEVAAELNVGSVLEGSVRFANNRVRVTAQLIETANGNHLWSETYEHEFEDLFAIESAVAMNVANALEAEFTEAEQQDLYTPRTESPQALALFWQAGSAVVRGQARDAVPLLDRAIALDPGFADAYALRAFSRSMVIPPGAVGNVGALAAIEASIEEDVEQSLSLDPEAGIAYAAIGTLHARHRRSVEAQAAYQRMYELLPNLTGILWIYADWSRGTGQFAQAIRVAEEALALDPTNFNSYSVLGRAQWYAGEYEQAAASFRTHLEADPSSSAHYLLAAVEATRGNHAEALEHLRIWEQLRPPPLPRTMTVQMAQRALIYSLIDRPEDAQRYRDAFETVASEGDIRVPPPARVILSLAFDRNDEALAALREIAAIEDRISGGNIVLDIKFNVWELPALEEPEFVELRAQLGQPDF